ncbi:MAG: HAD hydrolase-like protein [Candidatus Heimdallarchaeota archaeon]|nr:HAD hydrolase-like protein [Candidatus Heimdallarchaeota archaeon]
MPNSVETILFDYDGTLIDIKEKWLTPLIRAFERINGFFPEEQLREALIDLLVNAPSKHNILYIVKIMYGIGRAGGLGRIDSIRFMVQLKREYKNNDRKHIPFDGIDTMFAELKRKGIKVGIVTSAARIDLENASIDLPYLSDIPKICRGDVKHGKPEPDPILEGIKLVDANPDTTLYIGDFPADIFAGKAAKVMTAGILGVEPEIAKPRMEEYDPDIIIDFAPDIVKFV